MKFRSIHGGSNFSRTHLVQKFIDEVLPRLNAEDKLTVAVVGGGESDPEVEEIRQFFPNSYFTTFGIEFAERYLDLNRATDDLGPQKFDLILCSQVFEHIWNHREASNTLLKLAKPNGLIWVSVPASNRPHGSPGYFTAGLTADFLHNLFTLCKGQTLALGMIGTKRNYAATHSLPYWLSVSGHKCPILFGPKDRVWWKRFLYLVFFLPTNFRLSFLSATISADVSTATESWILVRA
jgi:SAM-dependent methyltransferase